jgi:DNA-binding response OmpR family regulator
MKILIVDDEKLLVKGIKFNLEQEGYSVETAYDGEEALKMARDKSVSLIVLDLMLPKKDGTDVCREIRANSNKPMIMITAKGDVFDKVLGLELGADDFVVKPFDMKELLARVKAVLRRYSTMENHVDRDTLRFDNMEISLANHELKIKGESVDIPHKELMLLYFLAKNFNRVYTRDQLLNKVWSFDYLGDSRTVDVHVKRLREKLAGVSDKWELKTVWGVGYKFEVIPQNAE